MQSTQNDIVCDTLIVKKRITAPTIPGINCETLNVNLVGIANPNILMTYINNVSYTPIVIILLNAKYNTLKYFSILPESLGFPIVIQTEQGVFQLVNEIQLVFCNGMWSGLTNQLIFYPTIQLGNKLVSNDYTGLPLQGNSVSFSADGNFLAIGGPSDNGGIGATWIFIRNIATVTYLQLNPKLVGTNYVNTPNQGNTVSLSADGNTLAVGGPTDSLNKGAVWIFSKNQLPPFVYSQQGSKLVDNTSPISRQGWSVSLTATGNILAYGGPDDNANQGAVWIWVKNQLPPFAYSQQQKLIGIGSAPNSSFGYSIALTADGATLAIGGYSDNLDTGAVWIWIRNPLPPFIYSQQGAKLVDVTSPGTRQGFSVALSSDGNTLAYGGPFNAGHVGAAWIWLRNPNTLVWSQSAKLIGSGSIGASLQGISISLSSSGNTLAVGARDDNATTGATWIFTRDSTTGIYTQQTKLIGSGGIGAHQGQSVSLTAEGSTLAIGGYFDNGGIGATWIFL